MTTWIYQVNPARFDVNGCLAEAPARVAWSASQYKKDMKPNNQVFVWRAKADGTHGDPGIIAEFAIDSFVTRMPADSLTRRFSRGTDPTGDIDRVWLRIISIAMENSVLTAGEIARHELLKKVGPLGFNYRAHYKVSADQSHALNSLWAGRTKHSSP
ncbi:MAG: hypothetical protein WA397_01705 [Roseiarcus sp.]